MPTAETRVLTDRASRYLVQLCEHLNELRRHAESAPPHQAGARPPSVQRVEYSDTHGVITFPTAECTANATDDALTIRVSADDDATLARMQGMFAARLETIGRRDGLTVTW